MISQKHEIPVLEANVEFDNSSITKIDLCHVAESQQAFDTEDATIQSKTAKRSVQERVRDSFNRLTLMDSKEAKKISELMEFIQVLTHKDNEKNPRKIVKIKKIKHRRTIYKKIKIDIFRR